MNALNQIASLSNIQCALFAVVGGVNEPYANSPINLLPTSIKKIGESWAFSILLQGERIATIIRGFDNEVYRVIADSDKSEKKRAFRCDTTDHVISAIQAIVKPLFDSWFQGAKEKHLVVELEKVTGRRVRFEDDQEPEGIDIDLVDESFPSDDPGLFGHTDEVLL